MNIEQLKSLIGVAIAAKRIDNELRTPEPARAVEEAEIAIGRWTIQNFRQIESAQESDRAARWHGLGPYNHP